jgi:hypothetical protein
VPCCRRPPVTRVTEIDREEPGGFEELSDLRLGGSVIAGEKEHAAAARITRIGAKQLRRQRVRGLHHARASDELRHDFTR